MQARITTFLVAAAASLAGCGGVARGLAGEGGSGAEASGSTDDSGISFRDAHGGSEASRDDSGAEGGGHSHSKGGGAVDAGYYFGDGSFWVEGGAYPDASFPSDASGSGGDATTDAPASDATTDAFAGDASGCGSLASCCPSLSGSSKSLCKSVVAAGDGTNCAAELALLQGAGDCTGVTILASHVEVPPSHMVSDGRLLFWTTHSIPALLAMPVEGGPITILVTGPIDNSLEHVGSSVTFLAVDDTNVYLQQNAGIVRIPKAGGVATLVNESGAEVIDTTTLGSTAYWVENAEGRRYGNGQPAKVAVKSAPLMGNTVSLIAKVRMPLGFADEIAVTSSVGFLGNDGDPVYDFARGAPAPTLAPVSGGLGCSSLASDTNAAYCGVISGSNLRFANDGTTTDFGPAVNSTYIVVDGAYVYWADATSAGAIKRAPKAGGTATVLAYETSPTAIAVDSRSVYWSDLAGHIKSMPR